MFKEYDLAVKYYTTAAEQINDRAGLSLGCMYVNGRGVDQNY
ncbi:hypothetical protein [Commensalibacter papalotli (ex Botero et al. 2024)]|nr:hypothetical protein [Commensalibacter papalotli (ex Botero et al. 2024)]